MISTSSEWEEELASSLRLEGEGVISTSSEWGEELASSLGLGGEGVISPSKPPVWVWSVWVRERGPVHAPPVGLS